MPGRNTITLFVVRGALLFVFYSGQVFFVAAAVFVGVVIADISGRLEQHRLARRVAGFLGLLAIPLAVLSAPPFPIPLAIATLATAIAYIFAGFGRRQALGVIAAVTCLIAVALEIPYHVTRNHTPKPSRLIVIGDSLASGGFGEKTPWPSLLEQRLKIPMTNLALASADVTTALERQIPLLPTDGDCVLIEIGGNDMIDGVDLEQFAAGLDAILAATSRRTVIMLELPLLPGRWSYGAVQRRLAKKHACTLVPKRVLAKALLGSGNTFDGIHLTQKGHDTLAVELLRWLNWYR